MEWKSWQNQSQIGSEDWYPCPRSMPNQEGEKMRAAVAVLLLFLGKMTLAQDEVLLSSHQIPAYFVLGAGTSAYQVEGAVSEGGRSPGIWDIFTHAGRMVDNSNGDVAADQYHKYREDVKLMADMGLDAYRFSISWSRILPDGRGKVNQEGLKYYNNLIDELLSHGIEPHVTLHHLDHPQVLEDEYDGWLSLKMVEDFTYYADVCFKEFGDRVMFWTTINEPNIYVLGGFDQGIWPPARCSYPYGNSCPAGNSTIEPYIALHHMLLAHASAFKLYKHKYLAKQKGKVGFNLYAIWYEPFSNSTLDVAATQRALDYNIGWVLDPLMNGDYPMIMKKRAVSRIPSFSRSQSRLVKGSFDFLGLNQYLTLYVKDDSTSPSQTSSRDVYQDMFAKFSYSKDEEPGGQTAPGTSPLPFTSWALRKLLLYLKNNYGNPPVYIHESGYGLPANQTLNDTARVDYLKAYLNATLSAVRDGSKARGYFVWSFLDVFEYLTGYATRYGLYKVDFSSKDLTREAKLSAHWYTRLLKTRMIDLVVNQYSSNHEPDSSQ